MGNHARSFFMQCMDRQVPVFGPAPAELRLLFIEARNLYLFRNLARAQNASILYKHPERWHIGFQRISTYVRF